MKSPFTQIQRLTLISVVIPDTDQRDVSDVIYGQENHMLPLLLKLGLQSNRLPVAPILITEDWKIVKLKNSYVY